jgi:hypothetical protein
MKTNDMWLKLIAGLMLVLCLCFAIACGSGGGGSGPSAAYAARIADYKEEYGKSDEWEDWMIANSSRYEGALAKSSAKPDTITISYQYDTDPESTFETDWADEADHMSAFATMAGGAYPGYNFNFVFEGDTTTSYANVTAGMAENCSRAEWGGKLVYLYHEGIFNHEFGHIMMIPHHYDDDPLEDLYLPPGETDCIMARNSYVYCSACRTALGISLDVIDETVIENAMNELGSHSSRE